MEMNQNRKNIYGDLNLLIPNIDTTSERLPSDNTPGAFLRNIITEKNSNRNKNNIKVHNTENKIQKYSNNFVNRTMRNTQHNYSNNKENLYSQKETQEMTHDKSNKNSKNKINYKNSGINNKKSENYKNIVKKINMISLERGKNENNKIPTRPKRNISNINNTENKDSYLYLNKLKKTYSSNKLREDNSMSTNCRHIKNNGNKRVQSKDMYLNKKNLTLNNFYPSQNNIKNQNLSPMSKNKSNSSKKIRINNDINNSNKTNKLNRNISFSYFNKTNLTNNNTYYNANNNNNNDISEILKVRKKFNQTCKYFYTNNEQRKSDNNIIRNLTEANTFKKINIMKSKINNKNNIYPTSDYSTINPYWNKRAQDTMQKMSKIKNDLFQKEENEIQHIPKINQKSKELAINSGKYNIEFNNIYDRLFYINNLNLNLNIDNENNKINGNKNYNNIQYQPLINEKSKNIKRSVQDLYQWQNEKEKKIKENEENIYKQTVYNKKNTNLISEEILKERRPNYIHKKVEDRLIEQGKNQKIKNEKEKEKNLQLLTEQRIFVNNNFNNYNNIKSKYLEQKKNNLKINNDNDLNKNENNENNFYTIANMRNYDNFNKKLIYYGDKLNSNSFYYYNKYNNKSLNNKNQKSSFSSRSTEKIKCFDDNIYCTRDHMNNSNYSINQLNQRNYLLNSRIPKDFNKISRPQTSKNNNNNSQNRYNLQISDLSYNSFNSNIINDNNKIGKYNENRRVSPYFSLLYNDMNNYNSNLLREANNNNLNKPNQNYNNKNDLLKININNNIIQDNFKNEISINSHLSSLNNINNNKDQIIKTTENNNINLEKNYFDINNNTGKFNISEYPKLSTQNNFNRNLTDNINRDLYFIENNNYNNNQKQNNINYNYNINNETASSSNTSKIDRRTRRKEDLIKIINFSDNLYVSQTKDNLDIFNIK